MMIKALFKLRKGDQEIEQFWLHDVADTNLNEYARLLMRARNKDLRLKWLSCEIWLRLPSGSMAYCGTEQL